MSEGATFLYATGPMGYRLGIQRWANSCSLAVTKEILVSFFSSAY